MTVKRLPLILFLFVLLAGGCSDKDTPSAVNDAVLVPLGLSVSVEGNVSTRSATTLTDGNIGIYLLAENGYLPGAFLYSGVSGNWTAATPVMLSGDEASVCAWYPYDYRIPADPAELQTFPLNAQKYTPASDLCYQTVTGGLNNRNSRLAVQLQHAYAQIAFRLSRDITFKTAGNVGDITLSAPGLLTGMTLDISSGGTANPVEGNVTYSASVVVPESGEVLTALLLPPATLTGDLTITFRVDGQDMNAVLPYASLPQLESGNKYTLRGVLQRELDITVTVEPADGNAGGEIEW